jgi:hypothetical protein
MAACIICRNFDVINVRGIFDVINVISFLLGEELDWFNTGEIKLN